MVYAPGALRELLHAVVDETGGVFERDLARIFENLLAAWLPASLVSGEGDELASAAAGAPDVHYEVERHEMESVVRDLVESMTAEDLTVFVCKLQGQSDNAVAERLGRSRPWVADRKNAILGRTSSGFADRIAMPLQDEAAARLLELASDTLGEALE